MEFRILGTLEVVDGLRTVHVAGGKQRALLALFLLHANRVLSVDSLIDQLWSGSAPPGANVTLRGYVSALRKSLEPDRPTGERARVLLTRPSGYLLVVKDGGLDAVRFQQLAEEGRLRLGAGDAEGACSRFTQALGLWRGPALADFVFEDFAQTEAIRLKELRLNVTEGLMQAALDCGDHSSLVPELTRLVEAHPLRERLRGLLMVALYRSGRQAAALAAYQQGRRMLADNLGIEPSPELKSLEDAVLRQDESLTWTPALGSLAARRLATRPRLDGVEEAESGIPAAARFRSPVDAGLSRRGGDPPFVGRDAEVTALRDRLARVEQGAANVALLEGPAGIGKSRLLHRILAEGRSRGVHIVAGRAEELERARPFGVLVDAFDCHSSSPDPDRALIARLLDQGQDDPEGSGPGLQFRVIEAFSRAVERLCTRGPMVLAVEDLHWADASSLVAFRWMGRRLVHLPLLLVATFRPTPVRAELLGLIEAFAEENAAHLHVCGLDAPAVDSLVRGMMGAEPGPLLRRLVDGAAGNPLFVSELLKALVEEERVDFADGRAEVRGTTVPSSLRSTILHRLRLLPQETVEVLRLASVLGTTFSPGDVSLASRRPLFVLLSDLDAAVRARLVREEGTQLAFEHDLVRQAIYEDLPRAVRAALHQEVGRALATAGAPAARVATHLALGAVPGDREAVSWLRRAAREVTGTSAGIGAELLQRAVDLVLLTDPQRSAVVAELASALMWAGRVTEGVAIAQELLALDHEPGFEGALRLALGRALMMLGRATEAVDVDEQGAALVGLPDWQRVQLRADASFALMLGGDLDTARRTAVRVREQAGAGPDDVIVAVSTLSEVALFQGELGEAITLGREVVDSIERCRDPWIRHFPSHYWLALCLTLGDGFGEAEEVVAAGLRAGRERGSVWVLPSLYGARALCRFLAGRWDDAVEDAHASVSLSGDLGARQGLVFAHTVRSLVALHRDDLAGADRALEAGAREPDLSYFMPWMAHARALLEEARGKPAVAFGVLAAAWEEARSIGIACVCPTLGPDLIRLAILRGETALARVVADDVEAVAVRMRTASATGAALRSRGLVERDATALLQAVSAYRRSPRPVALAFSCEDAGRALAGARPDEAFSLLQEALGLYRQAGAEREAGRVATELRSIGEAESGAEVMTPRRPNGEC